MKEIGLFFGSFNPIHIGHLILANYLVETTSLDEIWFVVSPQNPFKEKKSLLSENHRLDMVERAIQHYPKLRASNVEFSMPKPSYTIDTLTYLKEKFPKQKFSLIMGEDILETLHKWKNGDKLVEDNRILVYPRLFKKGETSPKFNRHPHIELVQAPVIELSSTLIRQMIREGKSVRPMLPPEVFDYLDGSSFYRK